MNKKPKIVFAGAVQNCARFLPAVFANIEKVASLASETAYVFVENDSTDGTKEALHQWGQGRANFNLINMDGLKSIPVRGLRLEIARGTFLELIKTYKDYRDYDLMIVLDMDDAGAYPLDIAEVKKALDFLAAESDRAAVFANQIGKYYDVWTLREAKLCPGDAWEEVMDYVMKHKVSPEEAHTQTFAKRVHCFPTTMAPFEVESAFGGLGIYKMSYVVKNPNPYLGSKIKAVPNDDGSFGAARWQVCEHVHFNHGIRSIGGRLFIMPSLINGDHTEGSFPPIVQFYFR
jgi:hypothetical protein